MQMTFGTGGERVVYSQAGDIACNWKMMRNAIERT